MAESLHLWNTVMDPATPEGKRFVEEIANIMEQLKDDPKRDEYFRFAMQATLGKHLKDTLFAYRVQNGFTLEASKPVTPALPSKAHHGRRSRRAITNVARL